MIYDLYQAKADIMNQVRFLARTGADYAQHGYGILGIPQVNPVAAVLDVLGRSGTTHERPPYGIVSVRYGNRTLGVREEVVARTPFCTLLRFAKKDPRRSPQPKLLVVAPMSGHFATLLRGTVQTVLPDHDVYITDWHNARDVPLSAGQFGFDEFVEHIIRFIDVLGAGVHVMAVCQPTVGVLAAVALMAEDDKPNQPPSMTLMAGPIDTRINPTRVNDLAKERSIKWFEKNLIGTVPWRYAGRGRRVYPGFMQLMAFMSMNIDRHISAQFQYLRNLVMGQKEAAEAHRQFYDEYLAVMDLPAEFYLETVQRVFQEHDLPLGRLRWRGRLVNPAAIRRTALLTVEGERDDICAIGQTMAAQDLCANLSPAMKRHHLQTGVGHYGVFNGRRWATEIYPLLREVIQTQAPGHARVPPTVQPDYASLDDEGLAESTESQVARDQPFIRVVPPGTLAAD